MHPLPSPKQTCPTSDVEGLGGGCIKLNEFAAFRPLRCTSRYTKVPSPRTDFLALATILATTAGKITYG